jgi:hypothetical protein
MGHDLHLFVPDHSLSRARDGQVPIFRVLAEGLTGWRVHIHRDGMVARHLARFRAGFAMVYKQPPAGPRCLSLRRAYLPPFWRIERTEKRWEFDIARASFDPIACQNPDAARFYNYWQSRLFEAQSLRREGFLYLPLQGHVRTRRSFQAQSPLQMIETTLAQDPRPVIASLHPKETYAPADRAALDALSRRFPRFTLSTRPSAELLAACDHVVTQNSAVALHGFFAGKQAVLFADIDFHHIAGFVPRDGVARAFARLNEPAPDFAAYLLWFFRTDCINTNAPDAAAQVRARLSALGWPV